MERILEEDNLIIAELPGPYSVLTGLLNDESIADDLVGNGLIKSYDDMKTSFKSELVAVEALEIIENLYDSGELVNFQSDIIGSFNLLPGMEKYKRIIVICLKRLLQIFIVRPQDKKGIYSLLISRILESISVIEVNKNNAVKEMGGSVEM